MGMIPRLFVELPHEKGNLVSRVLTPVAVRLGVVDGLVSALSPTDG